MYDDGISFEENAANLMVGIAALQPRHVVYDLHLNYLFRYTSSYSYILNKY